MGTVFHKKELLVLLQDFYCLTGLRAVDFDSFGMEVLSYPPELPAYCRLIRSVPNGKKGGRRRSARSLQRFAAHAVSGAEIGIGPAGACSKLPCIKRD